MPNSLDALCRRFGIDNSMRTSHNALLDVQLLAQVYLELMGGRQPGLVLATTIAAPAASAAAALDGGGAAARPRTPRPIVPGEAELAAHAAFVAKLKDPLWLQPPFAAG
jgi:DNA polymerase-3 subunit epsilon